MFKFIPLLILIYFAAAHHGISDNCQIPCVKKTVEPFCIFDGKTYNIFNNECALKQINCTLDHKLTKAPIEKCIQPRSFTIDYCDFACPEIDRPLCARDEQDELQLFKNGCIMSRQACKDRTKFIPVDLNMCKKKTNPEECLRACPLKYEPKCAFNGETFSIFGNDCDLNVANCLESNIWSPVHMVSCKTKLGSKLDTPIKTKKQKPYPKPEKEDSKTTVEIDEESEEEYYVTETIIKKKNCPHVCKKNFAPVCATDGIKLKIFSNDCLLEKEKCEKLINWKIIAMSECLKE